MARKKSKSKKSNKSKKSKQADKPAEKTTPEGFWRQAVALLLVVVFAPLTLLAMIGAGGSLSDGLFSGIQRLVGVMVFLVPVLFVFIGIQMFRAEAHKLPRSTFWGIVLLIMSVSGLAHLMIERDESQLAADEGRGGGIIGHLADSIFVPLFGAIGTGLVLSVVGLIALLFILKVPIKDFIRSLIKPLRRGPKTVAEELKPIDKNTTPETHFTLNEGVPIETKSSRTSLKNSAQKLTKAEDHNALTTVSDPDWKFPGLDLLNSKQDKANPGDVDGNAELIKQTLHDFNIDVDMEGANVGPRVTQYTLKPPSGVRLSKITSLDNNLSLTLAAESIRIEAPIPGKRAVGIEVPNQKPATVRIHNGLNSDSWSRSKSPLSFVVGMDIAGTPMVGELDAMPHILIAGQTGSGKSVMINSLLVSLLYRNSPSDMKMILVDPKRVELKPFDELPHLLTPVITEPEKTISALKWAVAEMERRYQSLSEANRRNIVEYNALKKEEGMPYIVIVIDELADLMMMAARDVESLIVRLAQKARAVGIHLVLATQRPSVDVITGLIKANVPARIAFTTSSQVDSRTILDQVGAEKLLGKGDMLFSTPSMPKPKRVQGVLIDIDEVEKVTDFVRMQRAPEYDDEIISQPVQLAGGSSVGDPGGDDDSLYDDAVQLVIETGKASTSYLQRRFSVGYTRAARLIDMMEERGIVAPAQGNKPRDVLVTSMDDVLPDTDDQI
jgi:S-DNA-T family DNA segregation ATPase FtsK/SpoIIIE